MRLVWKAVLVGVLAMGLGTGDALAKDKKKGKKKGKDDKIVLTGIQSFDNVFARVDEIDGLLKSSERSLNGGQRDLNTSLELKKGAPFSDAIAELRERADGKLQLTLNKQNVPKLSVTDAVPTNVQTSVDAFNSLTLNVTNSLADLASIGPEIDKLVKQSKKMPANLKDEFKNTDGNGWLDVIFALPKTSKALTTDIRVTKGLPGRSTAVSSEMTSMLTVARGAFPVADDSPDGRDRDSDRGKGADDGTDDGAGERRRDPDATPADSGKERAKPAPVPRAEQPRERR